MLDSYTNKRVVEVISAQHEKSFIPNDDDMKVDQEPAKSSDRTKIHDFEVLNPLIFDNLT